MFEEPKFDEEGSLIKDSISEEEKNRRLQIGLNNDILITNCGVPLIFVINKTDNPCPKYEEKFEFILKHIRKMAINYGATIIYTSTKKKLNIQILYDYIFYTLYNFDMIHPTNMRAKNLYFIPSGYDRMSILKSSDNQHDIDNDFSEVIKDEEMLLNNRIKPEEEVVCEKVSDFLKKVKDRIIRSRKSVLKNELKFGKMKMETEEKNKKIEDSNPEKLNRFDVFIKKKEGETSANNIEEKNVMSKEERAKKTRENIMNKLNLKKSKK